MSRTPLPGDSGEQKAPTMADLLRDLPAQIMESSRLRQEEAVREAQRVKRLYDWIDAKGIDTDKLPPRAKVLLGIVGTGSPIHPKDADYLNAELLELRRV